MKMQTGDRSKEYCILVLSAVLTEEEKEEITGNDNIAKRAGSASAGKAPSKGARHARPGELLVIDAGGTRIKAALSAKDGLDAMDVMSTSTDYPYFIQSLADMHREYGSPQEWSIALPGNFDEHGNWKGFPSSPAEQPMDIKGILKERGLPAPSVCQDTEAALLGEANGDSIFLLQLSTGIGCGATDSSGRAMREDSGDLSGLWNAHVSLDPNGPECSRCGNNGCASSYASLRALSERFGHSVTPSELKESSDPKMRKAYDKALWAIGELAARSAQEFGVPEVRLAGGISQAWGGDLVAAVEKAIGPGRVKVDISSGAEQAPLRGLDPRIQKD